MTTMLMKAQSLLGAVTASRVERDLSQAAVRSASELAKGVQLPVEVPTEQTAAWDPHEVWLSRVKQPREQHRTI